MEQIASLWPPLCSFLSLVWQSEFYSDNWLELTIESEEGDVLLEQDKDIVACLKPQLMGKSIFILLLEEASNKCWLCNVKKGLLT